MGDFLDRLTMPLYCRVPGRGFTYVSGHVVRCCPLFSSPADRSGLLSMEIPKGECRYVYWSTVCSLVVSDGDTSRTSRLPSSDSDCGWRLPASVAGRIENDQQATGAGSAGHNYLPPGRERGQRPYLQSR